MRISRMPYTIKISLELDRLEARYNGDFAAFKYFEVYDSTNVKHPKKEGVSGKIVQLITKKANVFHYNKDTNKEEVLDTSNDIEEFTSRKVKFVCDSYIEIFDVKNGESLSSDNFSNGAIVPYDKEGAYIVSPNEETGEYEPEDKYRVTRGTIVQTGVSIFIPQAKWDEANAGKMPWCGTRAAPANGLKFIPVDPIYPACKGVNSSRNYWSELLTLKDSNPIEHTVLVEWGYYEANKTKISQEINRKRVAGGARRTHRSKLSRNRTRRNK